jgi:very-short-patch-repair endonuclease
MRPKRANPSVDEVIAGIAARQHGIITLAQLVTLVGISPRAVAHRVAAGRLHRVYRGVYAGRARRLEQRGEVDGGGARTWGGCCAEPPKRHGALGLLAPREGAVDVTVPSSSGRRRRPGIRLHRSPSLPIAATTRRRGIGVTTPARTIADLRRAVTADELRRAIRQAEFLGLDLGNAGGVEGDLTRSRLERRFLRMCRRHRLPKPEVNTRLGLHEVDFLWRDRRLIVETGGYGSHRGRVAFEDDRAKDVELKLLGYEVVRFTWRQVTDEPKAVAAKLRALLTGPFAD